MYEDKAVVFIDRGNLYHIIRRLFPDKKLIDFNFEKFLNYIAIKKR